MKDFFEYTWPAWIVLFLLFLLYGIVASYESQNEERCERRGLVYVQGYCVKGERP